MVKFIKGQLHESGRRLYVFLIDGQNYVIVAESIDDAHKVASELEVKNAK